jgi:signal transduction histidine kinase/ligand-binding sensor domain-containing protein
VKNQTMKAAASFLIAAAVAVARPVQARADDGRVALLSGYTMTSWTLADGIPIGPVSAMVQDTEGYLWLGTTSGVVRFDGARFTPWEAIYPTRLPHRGVLALGLSRDGSFWIGFDRLTDGVSVGVWRNGVLTYPTSGLAPRAATSSILEDRTGCVWAVSDGALHRLRHGRWDMVRTGALGRATVVSVREDAGGAIWIGTRHGVFRTRDGDAFDLVEAGIARETSHGADGALWMTDPVHGARRQGARAPMLGVDGWGMRLLHDSRGNLWVGTTGQGLWRVRDTTRPGAPLIEQATRQTGLSSDMIQTLLEDREGNIWVGTMLGLHSLTPQELMPLASGALVRALLPEADGSIWAGTASGLMQFRREGDTWRGRTVSARWDIRSLYRDTRGQAWARTDHGLRSLERGQLVDTRTPNAVDPPCSAGAVAAAPAPDPAVLPRPFCVVRDTIWAASDDGAVTARRGEHTVATFQAPLPSTAPGRHIIDTIFEDALGTMWAGGTAGLWRVREGRVEQIGEREGLPAQRVMAITQSLDGDLWLAVDRGPRYPGRRAALVRMNPSDVDRATAASAPLAGYRVYDAANGLAGVPLGAAAAARSTDGSLWFSIGGSLTVVDPAGVSRDLGHPPPALIAGVTIDESAVTLAAAGMLPPGTRKIQIDYTALRLTAPRQIRFRYRLDGFDPDWVDAGARRQAYYTNLAPGKYVFRVRANGGEGTWAVPEAQWTFTVRPAFRQTAWFYALCGIILLLAAWGAAQTRVWVLNRQFAATLAERARLSREIHDTMLQSLVGIALQVQAIARRCAPQALAQQAQLVALRREVEEHIREARQAVMNLRSPMLESRGLTGALAEAGRRAAAPSTRFEISANPIAGLPVAMEGELLRIGQEAIANAARHACATSIRVELREEPDAVSLRVIDDGRGFDVDTMSSGISGHYGLTGMQERTARLGGRLTVSSSARGTVVEASIPCARSRQ